MPPGFCHFKKTMPRRWNSSEKVPSEDGGWSHRRIVLRPDSDQPGFEPIGSDAEDEDGGTAVVAELLVVLPAALPAKAFR